VKSITLILTLLMSLSLACAIGGAGARTTDSPAVEQAPTIQATNALPPVKPAALPTEAPQVVPQNTTPQGGSAPQGQPVLYLGIMVHLEGWDDGENQTNFEKHAQLVRTYASLFKTYGGRLTLESKEMTDGILRWGDNVLLEMEQRGHGIGVHADAGGQKNYRCNRFTADLEAKKTQLESLGVTVRHVSGIVSHCDWVTAAADAGYLFTTGQVAYSVMSMPPEDRPPEYRDCQSPAKCHQTFPTELADRLHPWRMNSAADWLTPDPNGRLVMLPSSGGLYCLAEVAQGQDCKDFDEGDIEAFFRELDKAIALSEAGKVNIYYVSWSLGKPLDEALLETWLKRIVPYVEAGQVEWKTLPQMVDAYLERDGAQ
jgi:hypothetical protein